MGEIFPYKQQRTPKVFHWHSGQPPIFWGKYTATKYSSKLLQESMEPLLVRQVRYADADHATVHAFSGNWYQVDLVQRICRQEGYNV